MFFGCFWVYLGRLLLLKTKICPVSASIVYVYCTSFEHIAIHGDTKILFNKNPLNINLSLGFDFLGVLFLFGEIKKNYNHMFFKVIYWTHFLHKNREDVLFMPCF